MRRAALVVVPPYFLSRLLVALGTEVLGRRLPQLHISGTFSLPTDPILVPLVRFDAQYYVTIMHLGYTTTELGQPAARYRVAFFPLFPFLGHVLGNSDWSLLAVSNAAFLAALFVIHSVAERRIGVTGAAISIWTLCFIPASLFFSLPYTESLFLLASAAVFLLADLGHPVLAGLAGVPAALTRVPGALLALPVAMHRDRRSLPVALLPPLGLGVVMVIDFIAVGDPLGFLHSQIYWHGPSRNPLFPIGAIVSAFRLRDPFHPEALGLPVLLLFAIAASWLLTRPATRDLGMWSLMLCALAVYQGYAVGGFQSVPRYLLVAFPCYLAFGQFFARRRVVLVIWLVVSAVYLTEMSALFGSGQFVG